MIAILSPAKNMRIAPARKLQTTIARRMDEACELGTILSNIPAYELESIMKISPELALKAAKDWANWSSQGGAPCILSYYGLAYRYLEADSCTDEALYYAQNHLRHLSALYGVLRPLDLVQPYRLEMNCQPRGMNLYQFWGSKLRDDLYHDTNIVINLASKEYSKAITRHLKSSDRMLTCEFLVRRGNRLRCLAAIAKMARGAMARYIIDNQIETIEGLAGFDRLGFAFHPNLSNDQVYTYVRTDE